ncbi:MAG: thioredoxin-dependent thiol peroxidase [Acidobacteriota bacterium]
MLKEGKKAPNFKVVDQDGSQVRLADLKGQKTVLYFYPKDDTPGCTKEACSFRDSKTAYKKKGIVVYGISADSEASHQKFIKKYKLPFTLLSDPDKKMIESFGCWVEKSMYGKKYMGIARKTFLLDEDCKIVKIFEKVNVSEHADEVIEAFEK